jgi:hypothetical protein
VGDRKRLPRRLRSPRRRRERATEPSESGTFPKRDSATQPVSRSGAARSSASRSSAAAYASGDQYRSRAARKAARSLVPPTVGVLVLVIAEVPRPELLERHGQPYPRPAGLELVAVW